MAFEADALPIEPPRPLHIVFVLSTLKSVHFLPLVCFDLSNVPVSVFFRLEIAAQSIALHAGPAAG